MTRPFFILSSGGSGTGLIAKALSASADVTIEHEYASQIVQSLSVYRHQGMVDPQTVHDVLGQTHGAAVHYARNPLWGDSSNKLSWLIPELTELFPDALFVHLVRDGRKVADSYFRPMAAECYDDRDCEILAAHLADPANVPAPPPEKRYWWAQPVKTDAWADKFVKFNRFERIAWHWADVNRVILRDLERVPRHRRHFVRIDELRAKPSVVMALFHFLGIPYRDAYAAMLNGKSSGRSADQLLSTEQAAAFQRIAGDMMVELGYAKPLARAANS